MRLTLALLLPVAPLALAACGSSSTPYVTAIGVLKSGHTMSIQLDSGTIDAYQPAVGQRRDQFTVAAIALPKVSPPPPPRLHATPLGIVVRSRGSLGSLLVRVPDGVDLVAESQRGDINVTDISGNVRVVAQHGNVDIKVPGYAQAAVGEGNLSVTMGAVRWPGALAFSTRRGDITVSIGARAAFAVHLHTGDGVLFTDFGLRGVSNGHAETIDGIINGRSAQRIDVEAGAGAIRLLRLSPQP